MKIERFWPRSAGALAIIALVLMTNEGYRHVRGLVDAVNTSTQDIAVLKREVYVLQVQLDNAPSIGSTKAIATAVPVATAAPAWSVAPLDFPMPVPMAQTLALPESPARPRQKPQAANEPKTLVSVVLLSDEKAASTPLSAGTKSADGPKMDVKLIGDAK